LEERERFGVSPGALERGQEIEERSGIARAPAMRFLEPLDPGVALASREIAASQDQARFRRFGKLARRELGVDEGGVDLPSLVEQRGELQAHFRVRVAGRAQVCERLVGATGGAFKAGSEKGGPGVDQGVRWQIDG